MMLSAMRCMYCCAMSGASRRSPGSGWMEWRSRYSSSCGEAGAQVSMNLLSRVSMWREPCGLRISTGKASKNSLAKRMVGTSGAKARVISEPFVALKRCATQGGAVILLTASEFPADVRSLTRWGAFGMTSGGEGADPSIATALVSPSNEANAAFPE